MSLLGREGRALRRTFGCCVAGTIFSLRSGGRRDQELDRQTAREWFVRTREILEGQVAAAGVYNIRFSAGKSLKQKLERFAEVLGIDCAARRMPEIFEKALDLALEKKDPKQKLERRRKRQAARSKTRLDEAAGAKKREARAGSRYTPSSVRERLFERAGYQCEFRGPGGVRCTARTRLEVDHIHPVGKGGSCGEENLRVFCRGHNLLAAAREFGEEFMRGKIEGRRAAVV